MLENVLGSVGRSMTVPGVSELECKLRSYREDTKHLLSTSYGDHEVHQGV